MTRGMVAAISVIALVFGWGVAHAQDASPGGVPGQAEPVAPSTAQGDVNIEVKPQPPAGTKVTTPMVPGTTTDVKIVPGSATTTTTTTTTPGDVKVEVEQMPAQAPAPTATVPAVTPPTPTAPAVTTPAPTGAAATVPPASTNLAPTPGGEPLTPEGQAPAINNGVTESTVAVPMQPLPDEGTHPHDARRSWMGRIGAGVLVGGGVQDFTSDGMRNMTSTGGTWNARVVAGTRKFVGLEAAYAGSAHNVGNFGLADRVNLVANGFEGAVRLNIPIVTRGTLLEPFGFAGVGWSHYSLTSASFNFASVQGSGDNIMTVPFGGGFAVNYRAFMADARFTYRQTYYNDMLLTSSGNNLNTWGISGQIGVGF
jgi:hypothetical protein